MLTEIIFEIKIKVLPLSLQISILCKCNVWYLNVLFANTNVKPLVSFKNVSNVLKVVSNP